MPSPPGPLSRASAAPPPRAGEGEHGYNLVMLMIIVTLLNVALAASLPLWSHVIQRDKEEELISRGFQYVEAIRVFQDRFQRPPIRLEELIEVKPRSIRRLWKDPMTEDGKWAIIPLNAGAPVTPQNPEGQPPPQQDPDGRGEEPENPSEDLGGGIGGIPRKGDEVMVGPLMGVHSRSGKKSILIFNGKERYDEWRFTTELLAMAQGARVDSGGPPDLSTRWIGRPLPAFLQQPMPQNGTLPGSNVGQPLNPPPRDRKPSNRPEDQ